MDFAVARIIAIETSGRRGSVVVAEGARRVAEEGFSTDQEHARELVPAADRACRAAGWLPHDLQHCYLSIGPGSFTGLRVAVTFARHLALAVGVRICAVPTLEVIAENVDPEQESVSNLAVVLDAKRGQVFGGLYEPRLADGGSQTVVGVENSWPAGAPGPSASAGASGRPFWRRVRGPSLIEPATLVAAAPRPLVVIGEGVPYHRPGIEAAGGRIGEEQWWWPAAVRVHELGMQMAGEGRFTAGRDLTPFYLRRPEAEELWEKRHGGPRAT